MKTLICTFLLFNLSLFAKQFSEATISPFIQPAKKAIAATVLVHADKQTQSGFFASPNGEILTLYHFLKDAKTITVEKNRQFYPATLISKNGETNIALLQIPGDHFPYLEAGSSKDLCPGEWTLIAGFPIRRLAVRRALISALNQEFLIVDTPFNQGELGGPLLNLEGEVIGINYSNANNLGLAVPLE